MAKLDEVGKVATTIAGNAKGETIITYHWTHVVVFTPTTVTLNSGGWRTATTKARMNQASNQFKLGYTVWKENHKWFVALPNGETVPFIDGMTFDRV